MKFILILALLPCFAIANKFNSPFLSFNTPTGWACKHIAGSWNCNSPTGAQQKGIIVITTKETKIGSNIKSLINKLKKPMKTQWNNKVVYSQPQSVEEILIRNHSWVQATHLNSEIPNSTTKYLVTVKSGLTILVSFTAHNTDYPSLSPQFIKSIESLKLNPKLNSLAIKPKAGVTKNINKTGLSTGNELDDLFAEDPIDKPKVSSGLDDTKKMGIALLLVLAVVFLFISKKRKKNR